MSWAIATLLACCAVLSLAALLLGAAWVSPLVAAVSQIQARSKGLRLLDNFALQVCRMGLVCLLIFLLLALGISAYLLQLPVQFWPQELNIQSCYPTLSGLFGSGIVLGLLLLFWKKLRQHKWLRLALSLLSWLFFCLFWLSSLNLALQTLSLPQETAATELTWQQLLVPQNPWLFWGLTGQFACLALGSCGLGAMLYLLLRRTKEDFGRDYYRFAQRQAAKWSLLFILQLPFWALVSFKFRPWPQFLQSPLEQILASAALLLLLAALGLGLRLLRSQHPMRHKLSPAGCALLNWLGLSCLCLSLAWVLLYP